MRYFPTPVTSIPASANLAIASFHISAVSPQPKSETYFGMVPPNEKRIVPPVWLAQ